MVSVSVLAAERKKAREAGANFVREKELTLSARPLKPSPYLEKILKEAEEEYRRGEAIGPFTGAELITYLKKL